MLRQRGRPIGGSGGAQAIKSLLSLSYNFFDMNTLRGEAKVTLRGEAKVI